MLVGTWLGDMDVIFDVLAKRSEHKISFQHELVRDIETLVREYLLIIQ